MYQNDTSLTERVEQLTSAYAQLASSNAERFKQLDKKLSDCYKALQEQQVSIQAQGAQSLEILESQIQLRAKMRDLTDQRIASIAGQVIGSQLNELHDMLRSQERDLIKEFKAMGLHKVGTVGSSIKKLNARISKLEEQCGLSDVSDAEASEEEQSLADSDAEAEGSASDASTSSNRSNRSARSDRSDRSTRSDRSDRSTRTTRPGLKLKPATRAYESENSEETEEVVYRMYARQGAANKAKAKARKQAEAAAAAAKSAYRADDRRRAVDSDSGRGDSVNKKSTAKKKSDGDIVAAAFGRFAGNTFERAREEGDRLLPYLRPSDVEGIPSAVGRDLRATVSVAHKLTGESVKHLKKALRQSRRN